MSNKRWFRIDYVGSCIHTPETRKIQACVVDSKEESFHQFGQNAIIQLAVKKGMPTEDLTVKSAFAFLRDSSCWPLGTTKSDLIRIALEQYYKTCYNT